MVKNAIRWVLAHLERIALPDSGALKYAPLFIVGPPRSGTTLLYLLLAHRFRTSYISNFLVMTPKSPVLLGKIAKPFHPLAGPRSFFNRYGETQGWRGPNQGYRVWNEWFPTERDYIPPDEITSAKRLGLRRMIAGIEAIGGGPFVNKWQRNAARIEALDTIFPEALFVRVTRDPVYIAQSLLKGKLELNGDIHRWYSVRPSEMPPVADLSPTEQVSYQAVLIDRQIERDLSHLGKGRSFTLGYEDLCANPAKILDDMAAWYAAQTGCHLDLVNHQLPSLSAHKGSGVGDDLDAKIAEVCSRLKA